MGIEGLQKMSLIFVLAIGFVIGYAFNGFVGIAQGVITGLKGQNHAYEQTQTQNSTIYQLNTSNGKTK